MEEPPPPPPAASPDPADLEAVFQALEEMLASSHPELAAFLEENIMGQCEPSGSEPVSVTVEEKTSAGNVSCGNNSPEPEGPDVHLLYLSRRAALRGRKAVRSRPGPALAGDDGCSSAGPCPDRYHDHHKILVNLKSLMRAHTEKLAAGMEAPSHPPNHFQQQLGTAVNGDLLQSPSTLGKASKTATLQNCSVPNPVTGTAGSAALTNTSGSDFQVLLDLTQSESTTVQKRVLGRIRNLIHGLANVSKWRYSRPWLLDCHFNYSQEAALLDDQGEFSELCFDEVKGRPRSWKVPAQTSRVQFPVPWCAVHTYAHRGIPPVSSLRHCACLLLPKAERKAKLQGGVTALAWLRLQKCQAGGC
ncbi:PREDICTED: uncharacterized protein LOC108506593 isoform X4 [Lepidothrix coronata]|uniref:Uncharacterized protein LOC108506593 isoform X4 n=1 Tax=Lepidothrix coronata TaxID=321398 RepID=A0A6J0ITG3_9PASS|nr:PREDICTED: uncharacterized protein LOC108506593 isoform X4 [Lepidothrix coronata]